MSIQLRAPDGLVHIAVKGPWRRTACEHRHGDRWKQEQLRETDAVTTCLLCLAEPDRSNLPVLVPS